jgi:hypothetical protein
MLCVNQQILLISGVIFHNATQLRVVSNKENRTEFEPIGTDSRSVLWENRYCVASKREPPHSFPIESLSRGERLGNASERHSSH